METEIQKVKDLFNSNVLYTNEFANKEQPCSEFPLIWEEMNLLLEYPCIVPDVNKKLPFSDFGLSVSSCHIDFQCHDTSIDEHTDDVERGIYFQLMVVSLDECTGGKYRDKRPEIVYFGVDGKKNRTRLDVNTSIVFNPRKPHSVIYYRYKYTVAVRSVVLQ
jgi:hypothetical protein